MTERISEKRIKKLGRLATAFTAVSLAAAGTGIAMDRTKTYASEPVTNWATPSASPEATSTQEVINIEVKPYVALDVLPGDIISGDVAMSNDKNSAVFPLYDQDTRKASDVEDNTKTALFVDVQVPGTVYAEWGATVTRGLTAEQKAEMLRLQTVAKTNAGFEKVDVVLWTGYDTTVDQAGLKANGEKGTVVAEPTGTPYSETNIDNLNNLDNQAKIKTILNLFANGTIDPESEEGKALMDILVNCLCSCENPVEPKPTQTPKPTEEPEVCVPGFKDKYLKSGQKITTPEGRMVIAQGDLEGAVKHDSIAETKAVHVFTDGKRRTLVAPWGADVMIFNECADKDFVKETYKHVMEQDSRKLDKNSVNQLKK